MAKKRKSSRESSPTQKDRNLYAFLATFLSIIGFVIALLVKKNDKYVMYYAKHSLVIFIILCVAAILGWLGWIPIIGRIISMALFLIVFIIWILSWMYALSGKEKEIPIVTEWANKIKF